MVVCSAIGCKSRSERKEAGITFHRFPLNSEMRNKWIENMKQPGWEPSSKCRLCSKHFEGHFFYKRFDKTFLRDRAAPTIFPELPKFMKLQKLLKRKMMLSPEETIKSGPSTSIGQVSSTPVRKHTEYPETAETVRLRNMLDNLKAKSTKKSVTIKRLGEKLKRCRNRIADLKIALKDLESEALVVCTEQAPVKIGIVNNR
ncbi:hypothetical protein NQ315_015259 [Exocentrus adspersus]|uniref:THAP-type domain-containing protein n=1 Tax=Exocentrus adspersus TaxID=1586481 RepID=A0AAV8VBA1_9CUCU|nr:hypothetical protein NQ315_015259 [Exocentrus adspersus]